MARRFVGILAAMRRFREPFDLAQLRGRERLEMREIEAQPVGRHQRSLLLYVAAQYLAQRRVQQMRGAVIERSRLAPGAVHSRLERVADTNAALLEVTRVRVRGAALVRVLHHEANPGSGELAGTAPPTARLAVDRRAVEHDLTLLTRAERLDRRALLQQRDHTARAGQPLVALEQRARVERGAAARIHTELACFLRTAPLLLHRRFKARLVDLEAALARHVGRQIERKAKGVVQLEHGVAIDHLRALQVANGALEQHHAVGERLREALLLLLQHALRVGAAARELRVRAAHLRFEHLHQLVEKRLLDAELVTVAKRAADDPAQHITAALVGRQHAVDHQERAGADVICDHAQRAGSQDRGSGELAGGADQVPEQVDVVVGMYALHDRRDALQPHAGVHRRPRQRLLCFVSAVRGPLAKATWTIYLPT